MIPYVYAVLISLAVAGNPTEPTPLRWGFDDIGVRGVDCWNEGCLLRHPKAAELMEEFQFDLWITWYPDKACTWGTARNRDYIHEMDAWCAEHDMYWIANQLANVWNNAAETCIDPDGQDWFNRPDGRRFHLFPPDGLVAFSECERLLGLMYDEAEHHQNSRNAVSGFERPSIYDPDGDELHEAADAHTEAVRALVEHQAQFGIELYTEHVFPVMYHTFARAGVTTGTKVLKETWSPVYIACALGAAVQYDTELWVTPDLWGVTGYPHHGPDAYRSSLVLAYHLGADCIYTESLALDHMGGGAGSLVLMTPEDYEVRPLGEAAKWFIGEYVPENPRYYTKDQVKPRVAIIRQEDGCWGQFNAPYPWTPDMLFGSTEWECGEVNRAWLDIWHVLTNGVVPREGLSWWLPDQHAKPYQVFCPLDGVVVFDHHARLAHFGEAEVLFLTGIGVSPETLADVGEAVRAGATCIALPYLVPETIREAAGTDGFHEDGAGKWLITDDFLSDAVRQAVTPVLPDGDIIRYQFGDTVVTLRPKNGDLNRLEATIEPVR